MEETVLLGNMAENEKTKVTRGKGVFKSFSGRLLKFEHARRRKNLEMKQN